MKLELEKRKSLDPNNKVTVYLDEQMRKLYQTGKDNGWDTPALARQAVTIALMNQSEKLLKKSES